MPRVCCLPRVGLSGGGAVKRRSKGDAGADGGFDGSGIAFQGGPHSYERLRTQGPGTRRRVGMHGAAVVRIPNPFAKSEATPSRPFVDLRNRLCHAERTGCAFMFVHCDSRSASRPPCTFIVARPENARRFRDTLTSILRHADEGRHPDNSHQARSIGLAGSRPRPSPGQALRRDDGTGDSMHSTSSSAERGGATSKAGDTAQESSKTRYCAFGNFYAGSPNGSQARRSRMTGTGVPLQKYSTKRASCATKLGFSGIRGREWDRRHDQDTH